MDRTLGDSFFQGGHLQGTFYQWALPLSCTVLFYGLAGGVWKQAALTNAQFCLLMVAMKLLLNPAAWLASGRPTVRWNAFLRWTLLGQFFNGLAWIFYFRALESGPASLVQTITSAYTALAAILAMIFLRERLVTVQKLGIALVIAAGLMLSGGSGSLEWSGWFASSLGTLLCWGVAVVIFKHAYNQEGANDAVFFIGNVLGMLCTMLPYGLLSLEGNWQGAAGLGLVVVALYAVGDLTLFAAIHRGPAAIVSPLSGLYPIPTLIYASVVLQESITRMQWLATAMVLVAIVLVVPADENPVRQWLQGQTQRRNDP